MKVNDRVIHRLDFENRQVHIVKDYDVIDNRVEVVLLGCEALSDSWRHSLNFTVVDEPANCLLCIGAL